MEFHFDNNNIIGKGRVAYPNKVSDATLFSKTKLKHILSICSENSISSSSTSAVVITYSTTTITTTEEFAN